LKITICLEKNFLIVLRLTIKKLKNSKLLARCTPKRNPLLSGFLFIQ